MTKVKKKTWKNLKCVHWASDVPLVFRQLPPVVKSANWTWFGEAHTCLYDVPQLTVSEQKPSYDVQEIAWRPLRQDSFKAQSLNYLAPGYSILE